MTRPGHQPRTYLTSTLPTELPINLWQAHDPTRTWTQDLPYKYNFLLPPHDKTNKMTFLPSKDRSAWASAQSDQSLLSAWRNIGSSATHWAHMKTDQTGRVPRLIWVFTGYTYFVGFVIRRLNFVWQNPLSLISLWRNIGSSATHWAQYEDWSDWADAQADLSLHWGAHILLILSWSGSILSPNLLVTGEAFLLMFVAWAWTHPELPNVTVKEKTHCPTGTWTQDLSISLSYQSIWSRFWHNFCEFI